MIFKLNIQLYFKDRGRSRWNDGTPNNVLLIRNLALHQTEGEASEVILSQ